MRILTPKQIKREIKLAIKWFRKAKPPRNAKVVFVNDDKLVAIYMFSKSADLFLDSMIQIKKVKAHGITWTMHTEKPDFYLEYQ